MPNQTPPPEPPRVTDGQIAEWDAVTNEASAGPWGAELNADPQWAVKGPRKHQYIALTSQRDDEPNARFIATARTAMPALIDEVKRLKAENAWQREQMAGIVEGNARGAVAVRTELHRLLDLYDVEANPDVSVRILTLPDSRAPRTTERL